LPGLFEPDTLLPIQYFEAMRRKHLLEGEKRLILSVLEDAVECFMKCIDASSSKGQRLFRDADEWIALEDKHWVFSFDNVCEMLDINPEYLRRGLKEWKERKIATLERQAEIRLQTPEAPVMMSEPVQESSPVVEEIRPASPLKPVSVSAPPQGKVFTPKMAHHKVAPVRSQASGRNLRKARA
jgi:hypothetical protein